LMGDQGIVASRVGEDSRGIDALRRMEELGLDIDHVQTDPEHSTGVVNVKVDQLGVAQYDIAQPVAWDFLEWNSDWRQLAQDVDAVCFGSLAQRSKKSCVTIRQFLAAAPEHTLKVFDVNLRQSYYTAEIIAESLQLADIVKLNDDELPKLTSLLGIPNKDEKTAAKRLIRDYGLKVVCITRGGSGSLLVQGDEISEHPGFRVRVADTVGSGDAFTAGMVHEYLHGAPLDLMNEVANLVGAWVASEVGAMPAPKRGALEHSLAEIR
jgi:fructokinase